MELTDLRYFFNAATAGSFAAGAKRSHVSPPAMSKAIRRLEDELSASLFVRTTRRVTLTDRGGILLDHCRQVFRQIEALRRDLDAADDEVKGDLRIGGMEVFSTYLLPHALSRVLRAHPALVPRAYEMTPDLIVHALRAGELDVGFTLGSEHTDGVDRHVLALSPGVLVCGPEHPLYDDGVITPELLAVHPSVVPRFFQRDHLPPLDGFPDDRHPRRVGATVELMQMGVQLALDGAFLGWFPQVTIRCYLSDGRLRALEGLEPSPAFELVALSPRSGGLRAGAAKLIEAFRHTAAGDAGYNCS